MRLFANRPSRRAPSTPAAGLLWIGRTLLFLSALSIITSPLTQHFWVWDHFLRGGQDFELTLLAVLISVSLALVLAAQCVSCIAGILNRWWIFRADSSTKVPTPLTLHAAVSFCAPGGTDPLVSVCNTPLRI